MGGRNLNTWSVTCCLLRLALTGSWSQEPDLRLMWEGGVSTTRLNSCPNGYFKGGLPVYLLVCLFTQIYVFECHTYSERERERKRKTCHPLVHLLDAHKTRDWARFRQELVVPSRSRSPALQGFKNLSHLMPSGVHISRKLDQKQRLNLIPGILMCDAAVLSCA